MKRDIETEEDIHTLVHSFYERALSDDLIGYLFTEVAQIDLEEHLPVLVDFWSSVLLGMRSYNRNVITPHILLHKKEPLKDHHFSRWRELFFQTLDAHFTGKKVEEAKKRVDLMIPLMKYKINEDQLM